MKTIYINFDNTITKHNSSDYIVLKYAEKIKLFESDTFLEGLRLQDGVSDFISKYKDAYAIKIFSNGTDKGNLKKQKWLLENIGTIFEIADKKEKPHKNDIIISDATNDLIKKQGIKILYKGNNNYKWQKGYENMDILVVNNWSEIDEIVSFYTKINYKTLKKE